MQSSRKRDSSSRAALQSAEVLGVVGSPLKKRKAQPAAKEQIRLFEE